MSLFFKTILLGIIQGITEFLPISSTGHMIIVEEYLDCSGLTAEPVSKFDRQKIRAVKVLIAFAEGTAPPRKYDEKRADPPECFANVHDDFVERASERGIAESTLRWKAHAATKMLRFLHGAGAR